MKHFSIAWFSLVIAGFPAVAQQKTMMPSEFISWLPVTDAERALKAPMVEKDAGAEVLLWRVRVVDELLGDNVSLQRVFYNYIRVKVFDDKGKEKTATIDLTYRAPGQIDTVSGRTIKADGTIVELDRKSITRRDLVRAGRRSEKAISFAMPAVEPGAIIEYRWKQTEDDNRFRYVRLHFQRDLPVENVTYYLKPLSIAMTSDEQMFLIPFHCRPTKPAPERDGWSSTTLENVPSLRSEPYAPSDPNIEQWALLFYRQGGSKQPDKYWNEEGKQTFKKVKEALKVSDEMKSGVADAIQGAKSDDEKLAALTGLLRKNVRAFYDPGVTAAEQQQYFAKLPKGRERTAAEIFKSGLASPYEINVLFDALAVQAGIDAHPALLADRTEVAFDPKVMADRYFLDSLAVAVKSGDAWKFFDVSSKRLAPGMLPWHEENVFALIADPKEPGFVRTRPSAPAESLDQHVAKLKLSEDGGLTGDIEDTYTGHRAEEYREELRDRSAAQREEWLHDRVGRMFPQSDVTELKIENVDETSKPLSLKYHLDAPHFAQVTGKRIFFQPNVFRRSQGAPFTASDRHYLIEFPYAWKEVDQIRIELPKNYDLDSADSPGSVSFGKIGSYTVHMTVTKGEARTFNTTRELVFGEGGNLYFDAASYPAVKKVFDEIRIRDTHTISIKAD